MGSKVALIIAQDSAGMFESRVDDNDLVDEGVNSLMYDGTGAGISIPTIVISQTHGNQLLQIFEDDPTIKMVLKADFETTNKNEGGVLEYELFYGSILDLDKELILSLYEYQHALGKHAKFIPRIKTFNC